MRRRLPLRGTSPDQKTQPLGIPEGRLGPLAQRFEQEYGDACIRLVRDLKERYPEITKRSRRTARALRNLCFLVWYSARGGDQKLIPALFHASVLLSAQDDYYDNPRISTSEKEAFCAATNRSIRSFSFRPNSGPSRQLQELTSLWSEVARPLERASPRVRAYWAEKACHLNDAMAAENRAARRANVGFHEYLQTAIQSIGIVFVWSTYLVHKRVSLATMRDMDPILLQGARIVRLTNDIASYRQRKNTMNAVILLGGDRGAELRVVQLAARANRTFRGDLDALDVGPDVKRIMLRSTEFLGEVYKRSDFDRRVL